MSSALEWQARVVQAGGLYTHFLEAGPADGETVLLCVEETGGGSVPPPPGQTM